MAAGKRGVHPAIPAGFQPTRPPVFEFRRSSFLLRDIRIEQIGELSPRLLQGVRLAAPGPPLRAPAAHLESAHQIVTRADLNVERVVAGQFGQVDRVRLEYRHLGDLLPLSWHSWCSTS